MGREVRRIQSAIRTTAVVAPPLPVLLVGILVLVPPAPPRARRRGGDAAPAEHTVTDGGAGPGSSCWPRVLLVRRGVAGRPAVGHARDAVGDRGQPFFPEFTDPNRAASLEVVEFDEQTSAARPFKVMNREGRWTIPSHQNYPADGASRLSSIAAAVIALKKDDVASDNVADHERCGVLDPLDETLPTPRGRGTRITRPWHQRRRSWRTSSPGRPVEGRPHLRYVRLPGERRVYVARLDDLQVSTRFEDWIERNLLQVERTAIDQIAIRNYTADAKTGRVNQRDAICFDAGRQDVWDADSTSRRGHRHVHDEPAGHHARRALDRGRARQAVQA